MISLHALFINAASLAVCQMLPEGEDSVENQFLQDTEKLSAYWSIGYYQATQSLVMMADSFLQLNDEEKSTRYYRKAIEYLTNACLLKDHPASQKMLVVLNNGEKLPLEEESKNVLLEGVSLSDSDYDTIRLEQKQIIDEVLNQPAMRP